MTCSRVIISADAHPLYAFFAPLTALMWREVANYHALVLFCGDVPELAARKTAEIIRQTDIIRVPRAKCCGLQAQSQLVRLLAYMAPGVDPDDYLLMGDVDAWPLEADAFTPRPDLYLMYDANAIKRGNDIVYPMGYIGAQASVWRELMGIDATDLREALEVLYLCDEGLSAHKSGGVNYDEHLITRRMKAWHGWPSRVHHVARDGFPIRGRIDRCAWPARPNAEGKIDAHLVRPGWTDENWPRVRPLLEQRLSPSWLEWCDDYRAQWVAQ